MASPTHDILIAEDYKDKEGNDKSYFTNIGTAWLNESGSISCDIRKNLSVSGRFIISPKKEK